MNDRESSAMCVARKVAEGFRALASVEAVALGGSQAAGVTDADSDVDTYVFISSPIPVPDREAIIADLGAVRPGLNQTFWDVADGWRDEETGIPVEAVYWGTEWIEGMLDRVLVKHRPGSGYSTYRVSTSLSWAQHVESRCE